MNELKKAIINQLTNSLEDKVKGIKHAIESAKESRDNETKSSVGDKYETGRTIMQFELEKNRVQLKKTEKLLLELSRIDTQKVYDIVEFGSLVSTNSGIYFISIGIGKISVQKEGIFCISLASPIGKMLFNKKPGDKLKFQDKEITILEIK